MLWLTRAVAVADRESLRLKFDGPALEDHSIDVRQLAPSLVALADLFDMAHARSGDVLGTAPALQVTANREGSFAVDLFVAIQEVSGTLRDALGGANATAAANGMGISSFITGVVYGAIKWTLHRNRRGTEESVHEAEAGRIHVTWADGTQLDVPYGARDLVESMDFNRTAGYVFEPLRHEGVDEVQLSRDGDPNDLVVVHRDDLPAFNIIEPDDDLISDNVRLVNLRLVNVPFKTGNKWRVSDGTYPFWVVMDDLDFLQRVSASEEAFSSGDSLYVRLRDQQFRTADGDFRMDRRVEKVMEHRRALPPEHLPFPDEAANDAPEPDRPNPWSD